MRRLAIRSIISERIRRGTLKVLDTLEVNEPRTKAFVENYKEIIGSSKTVLFVDEVASKNVLLASRNVPGVDVVSLNELNAYNLAKYETVVFTENTLSKLAEALRP